MPMLMIDDAIGRLLRIAEMHLPLIRYAVSDIR